MEMIYSIGIFSQIWLQDTYESKKEKFKTSFNSFGLHIIILEPCTEIWIFFLNFGQISGY
jgi:hypothetical protein